MAADLSVLKSLVAKLESDGIADLEAEIIPGLEALLNSVLPASVQPIAVDLEAAGNSALQAKLVALAAKIPLLAPVPAA